MKKQKFLVWTLVLVLIMSVFVSCSKTSNSNTLYPENDYSGKGEDMGFVADKDYATDWSESIEPTDPPKYDEKIIKNVNISAETRDYDKAFSEMRKMVSQFDGYEESVKSTGRSYGSGESYTRTAYLVVRIPAARLDEFLNQIGTLVNVTSENATVSNVTAQYYDIQSRIGVLEAEKQAYEEMLKKSDDVNYLLEIRDRLFDVIEEIESYKTQLGVLEQKVAYSTVTVNLYEVIEYTPKPVADPTFGERVSIAFNEGWEGFLEGCQDFAVWFVGALPTLSVFLFIPGIALIVILSVAKYKRKKKKAAKEEKAE